MYEFACVVLLFTYNLHMYNYLSIFMPIYAPMRLIFATSGPKGWKCSKLCLIVSFKQNAWGCILATSGPKARKCSKWAFRGSFWPLLAQGPEMLKMSLLRLILATSGPKARKCSKWAFWGSFWLLLGPRPGNAQNKSSEAHFGNFWAQGLKMLKIVLKSIL